MQSRLLYIAAFAVLSASVDAQVRAEFGVMIPMRDGVRRAADVWRPEAPGRYPVLLARTPYMKTGLGLSQWARYFASRGYVFAVQDTRGRGTRKASSSSSSATDRTAVTLSSGWPSSSAAPMYNPNQNTGNPVATDTEWKVAHQTIYHDRDRASSITLPVMIRGQAP